LPALLLILWIGPRDDFASKAVAHNPSG
jgi:hypothetical protein